MLKITLALLRPIESSWGGELGWHLYLKSLPRWFWCTVKVGTSALAWSWDRFQGGEAPWGRGNGETVYLVLWVGTVTMWTQWELKVLVAQSCPTLCDPMDCSPPGSSVHGILQARILEWVAIPFSRGSSRARDGTWVLLHADGFFTVWATNWAHWERLRELFLKANIPRVYSWHILLRH